VEAARLNKGGQATCFAVEKIRAMSRGEVAMANKERTIKSKLTDRSPASIFATRD